MNKLVRTLIGGASLLLATFGHPIPGQTDEPADKSQALSSNDPEQPSNAELQRQLNDLRHTIEQLQKKLEERGVPVNDNLITPATATSKPSSGPEEVLSEELDRRIDELIVKHSQEHDKRLVPSGVQTGYVPGNGFYIRSVPDPKWDNWEGKEKIPFELRVRGRAQLAYYNFSATGRTNSQTNLPFADAFGGVQNDPDFSALEVKRLRLIFEGHAFDPDLKYRFQLNGDTRGLGGFFNNNHLSSGSPVSSGSSSVEGGGVTTDHAVRLFEAWASYDLHGCPRDSGCEDPCCPHVPNYRPTYSLIFGKLKLLGPLEEYLGSGN
ncbi:MAG: hypothetical protein HY000_21730, partial [Planctomycetes bacterium]|nr:hypothetical protein [Planctomycetota bacterium]